MSVEAALREAHEALSRARAEILRGGPTLHAPFHGSNTAATLLGRLMDLQRQIDDCVKVCEADPQLPEAARPGT